MPRDPYIICFMMMIKYSSPNLQGPNLNKIVPGNGVFNARRASAAVLEQTASKWNWWSLFVFLLLSFRWDDLPPVLTFFSEPSSLISQNTQVVCILYFYFMKTFLQKLIFTKYNFDHFFKTKIKNAFLCVHTIYTHNSVSTQQWQNSRILKWF